MNAIPTVYGGVQFRSRLEARWAAFFDILRWRWEYEPLDAAGWIPDFYVWPHGGAGGWLIEVKPAFLLDDFDVPRYERCLRNCDIRGCEGVGLLGASVMQYHFGPKSCAPDESLDGCQLGWFLHRVMGRYGNGFIDSTPSEYRVSRTGADVLFLYWQAEFAEGLEMWREAGNRVQWKAPR